MTTSMSFEEHGEAIGNAATVLRANAGSVPLDAVVPTAPEWTVRDLVAHQGMVHRWATAIVGGAHPRGVPDQPFLEEAAAASDLLGWFDDGATALLQALATAPADRDVWFFLPDAPAPREGWARRQAHETTVHAVDAMAARLGRVPEAREVWFGDDLALDGIDELLLGFVPRDRAGLRYADPVTVHVVPAGTDRAWTVVLSPHAAPIVTPGAVGDPDAVLTGTPVEVYLGLWNRGDAMTVTGEQGVAEAWRAGMRVQW